MNDIIIRTMTIDDYDDVAALWAGIKGFGIRSIDDSREGIERFLRRNPNTSVVAEMARLLVPFSADMMAVRAVCIMSAWMLHTDSTALAVSL